MTDPVTGPGETTAVAGEASASPTPAVDRRRKRPSVEELAAGVLAGNRAKLSQAITLAESRRPADQALAQELIATVLPHTGGARRIGLTGVPGAGKSTTIEALGAWL
ncbi:MAG: hypothetical protein Q7T55_22595, partial [Solirubrobacteraceae bacterium]|nr:hypothetical protein [Solirubrobacteraceae bacterium]